MRISSFDKILRHAQRHHLMLLYDDEDDRNSAEIQCINKALAEGQYCIYATVNSSDGDFLSRLTRLIPNYDKHVEEGNLEIVNFMPFYESAAKGDLTLFREMKRRVETELEGRMAVGKGKRVLLVADAACLLTKTKQFENCISLESWWQETYSDWRARNMDVTIICAHPSAVLKRQRHDKQRNGISHNHSLTLDLNDYLDNAIDVRNNERQIRLLVVEPESDIQVMYRRYLNSLPIDLTIVAGGRECLQAINQEHRDAYDIIIIDTHIRDSGGLHIARRILDENPNQQIIFTTTWDPTTMGLDLMAHSLAPDKYAILHKPFMFSQLLGHIRPGNLRVHQ